MPEQILFESEGTKTRKEAARFLRQLADKLEQGEVLTLSSPGNEVQVELPESFTMEVKLEEEDKGTKKKRELEVEFEWVVGEGAGKGGVTLK